MEHRGLGNDSRFRFPACFEATIQTQRKMRVDFKNVSLTGDITTTADSMELSVALKVVEYLTAHFDVTDFFAIKDKTQADLALLFIALRQGVREVSPSKEIRLTLDQENFSTLKAAIDFANNLLDEEFPDDVATIADIAKALESE